MCDNTNFRWPASSRIRNEKNRINRNPFSHKFLAVPSDFQISDKVLISYVKEKNILVKRNHIWQWWQLTVIFWSPILKGFTLTFSKKTVDLSMVSPSNGISWSPVYFFVNTKPSIFNLISIFTGFWHTFTSVSTVYGLFLNVPMQLSFVPTR